MFVIDCCMASWTLLL